MARGARFRGETPVGRTEQLYEFRCASREIVWGDRGRARRQVWGLLSCHSEAQRQALCRASHPTGVRSRRA